MSREELMPCGDAVAEPAAMASAPGWRGCRQAVGRMPAGVISPSAGYRPSPLPMSLFLDIGTGAGLSSATGVRPYLPPLLAGGLARGDVAIDFDGTDFSFLESTGFLAAVVVVGVVAFLVERSGTNREGRGPAEILAGVLGLALGGLLFAGALADNGHDAWVGLGFGPLCAALGWLA